MEFATVALSGALVLVTGVYAWLTWVIAKRSGESADASRLAAEVALAAAESARRSAVISEAALDLDFESSPSRQRDGSVWIDLSVRGASAWVHRATLVKGVVLAKFEGPALSIDRAELVPQDGLAFPIHLPQGPRHAASLGWPGSRFRLGDWGCTGFIDVEYSFARDTDKMTRGVIFAFPEDFLQQVNDRDHVIPDKARTPATQKGKVGEAPKGAPEARS